jgi:hypothetical protein
VGSVWGASARIKSFLGCNHGENFLWKRGILRYNLTIGLASFPPFLFLFSSLNIFSCSVVVVVVVVPFSVGNKRIRFLFFIFLLILCFS